MGGGAGRRSNGLVVRIERRRCVEAGGKEGRCTGNQQGVDRCAGNSYAKRYSDNYNCRELIGWSG